MADKEKSKKTLAEMINFGGKGKEDERARLRNKDKVPPRVYK